VRVAVVTETGEQGASARYRALQHVPRLRALLGEVDVLLPDDGVERRGTRAGYFARHAVRYAERGRALRRALDDYDAVLVQRGVYPMGPGWAVGALERFRGRIVYDLDDAVFTTSPALARRGSAARWLYGPQQALRLARRADAVVVSTEALRGSLPAGVTAAAVLPSVPDVAAYRPARHGSRTPLRVGWVGNAGNIRYLDPLAEVFARLQGVAELEVVSSEPWSGPAAFRRWSLAEEASVFARYDVTLMPLPDTSYTRAKAGFKLLQSMAAGVPVLASPVGVNVSLVSSSGAGFLAGEPAEWELMLRALAADHALRADLGARGRAFAESYGDLDGQARVLAGLLAG
jgi:hypothetical protein